MTAPWDQRPLDEQARVEALVLASWLPVALHASPYQARRQTRPDERATVDRATLHRLAPSRERDLLADAPGGASAVLRPDADQVKRFASGDTLDGIARAIRTRGRAGQREAILQAYRPVQLHRGGAEGDLLIASSRTDLDRLHRSGARAAQVLGLRDDDVVLSAVPAGPSLLHLGVVHLAAGAGLTALHARGAGDDLDAVARASRSLAASVLVVTVEESLLLAAALDDATAEVTDVHTVVLVGPPPDVVTRERIADAYGRLGADVRVRALWAPSTGRSLWAECAEGLHGLHTTPDLEVLEVVDPLTGERTDGDGDLTLTSLGWHGTVHVRFQTGAWVDPLTTDPCPGCGRTVPRVVGDVVPHAWELPIAGPDARTVVDLRGVAAVLATVPAADRWRAELRGPDAEVAHEQLVVEIAGRPSRAHLEYLDVRIEQAAGVVPRIVTDVPDAQLDLAIAELGGRLADRR